MDEKDYGNPYSGMPTVGDLKESFGDDHFGMPLVESQMGQVPVIQPVLTSLTTQLKNIMSGSWGKAGLITGAIVLLMVGWQKGWFKNMFKE
jgi:hypothetical protein